MPVHPESACEGRPCVVHNPSDHHMREWPKTFRFYKGNTERICPHGVGHPDPDDMAWHDSQGRAYLGIHGCDGCCHIDQTQIKLEEEKTDDRSVA